MPETLLALWIELVADILVKQQERIEALETALETLETAVNGLTTEEPALEGAVQEVTTHLKTLEEQVKTLESEGTLSPEKATELKEKIDKAAAAVTVAVSNLKGA